jgi:hypothetical protein
MRVDAHRHRCAVRFSITAFVRYDAARSMTTSEAQPHTNSTPPAPRAVNSRASRRSWAEAPVRTWAILSLIVLLATIYFAVMQISAALKTRNLITHGAKVMATVDSCNGVKDKGRRYNRLDRCGCDLTFVGPDGVKRTVQGELAPQPGILVVSEQIELRVDPNDPSKWTDLLTPPPWHTELAAVIVPVPLLIFALAMMLLRRAQVLNVWRHGEPFEAVVVDSKKSAIAPRSRIVRFALPDGDDRRVFQVLYPAALGELTQGDELLLIAPPNKLSRAIVAELYLSG